MAIRIWSLVIVLLVWSSIGCLAGRADVLYQDDFSDVDMGWDVSADQGSSSVIENGSLVMTATKAGSRMCLNQGVTFKDAEFSCDFTPVAVCSATASLGAVMFWAKDYANFYEIMFGPPDLFMVDRTHDSGTVDTIVLWRSNPALSCGVGKTLHVRIVMKGNRATIFVNGKSLGGFSGLPPATGSKIGFAQYASATCPTTNVTQFDNVKVTDLPEAAPAK